MAVTTHTREDLRATAQANGFGRQSSNRLDIFRSPSGEMIVVSWGQPEGGWQTFVGADVFRYGRWAVGTVDAAVAHGFLDMVF